MSQVDEQQRTCIRDDLRGILKGQLLFDDVSRGLYSTDASIFQIRPLGVVVPRDEEDLQAVVRYASQAGVPLIARGAGTGVAGESLGSGLILDLAKNFRQILEVGSETVRVQPGVTYRALNERLAQDGRRFAPNPASGRVCTLGGMLANNASGSHALRLGYTRDHVLTLRAVLDTGEAAALGKETWPPVAETTGHFFDIVNALGVLLEQNRELIAQHHLRLPFNRCGYLLHDVFDGKSLDMARFLVGSEGTLGIITEALLRTVPVPAGKALVLLSYGTLDAALRSVPRILATQPSACDLMDRRLLSLARGAEAGLVAQLVPGQAEAVMLVEFESDSVADAPALAQSLASNLARADSNLLHAAAALGKHEQSRYWQLRDAALPSLYGLKGGAQPVPFVEDIAVPVAALPEFVRRVQDILQEHETTASFLIHAATGQVHTRPFLDLQNSADISKLPVLAEAIHDLALGMGGTVSTQHGTGLARTPWVARQFGPLYPLLRQIKAIFDPRGIFNPGKIVDPDPAQSAWPLRRQPSQDAPPPLLNWQTGQLGVESSHCNGCGQCRTEAPGQRMCPLFRATLEENATPRAKANLMRDLLHNGSARQNLASQEVREVADLCVNCKMCAHECPAHVNIPKLMLEIKAANVARHGLDRSDWFLSRLDFWASVGSSWSIFVNLALRSYSCRWLLEKIFGLSRKRKLPLLASVPFLKKAERQGWTQRPVSGKPWVALFVDFFPNYFDPLVAEAAVAVLRHNGFDVFVPAGQGSSGMNALAQGDVESAREICRTNLRAFAEVAREGIPILCLEPTACLMFNQDLLDLIDDADTRALSRQARELMSFLAELHRQGKLRTDFGRLDLTVGHHVPCHLKALGEAATGPDLLALVPGLRVETIDVSCSGMAGTFGLKAKNYQSSLAAGSSMLREFSKPGVQAGSTECSACRLQMEDGGRKRTLHPIQYLALAYGLVPEIGKRIKEPLRDLVLR